MTSSAPSLRLGCCASPDKADAVKRAGFDFIELPASGTLKGDLDGEEFAETLAALEHLPLPVEAFNVFLPGDMKVVGTEIDRDRIRRYVHHVMDRASAVGGKIMVFGSGRSRNVPEGFDAQDALMQIQQFLSEAGPEAEKFGVTIAIEPLNTKESNIINSVAEGVELAQSVDHPNVLALADLYHMDEENEPLDTLLNVHGHLAHVHVADTGRFAPGTGQYDMLGMFRRLKEIGYEGRVSVECTWRDFETEGPAAVAYLRETWEKA